MAIASLIVAVKKGKEESVSAMIAAIEGLSVHSVTENEEIIVIAEAPTTDEVGALAATIESYENVWSVLLAYVNNESDLDE